FLRESAFQGEGNRRFGSHKCAGRRKTGELDLVWVGQHFTEKFGASQNLFEFAHLVPSIQPAVNGIEGQDNAFGGACWFSQDNLVKFVGRGFAFRDDYACLVQSEPAQLHIIESRLLQRV